MKKVTQKELLETGYIYAPYVPLVVTETIMTARASLAKQMLKILKLRNELRQ